MAQGEWGGLQVRFDVPGLKDFVDGVQGLFQLAVTALDIVLAVAGVVKSFVSGLLNPIRQIIQQLLILLENLIRDFRRVGVYFNSDLNLILQDSTFSGIKGGYPGYERRMLSRLTNRQDLTRPDFSPSNTVFALFAYIGVDPTFVTGLLDTSRFGIFQQLIAGFARLLGLNTDPGSNSLPVPIGLTPVYEQASSRITPGAGTANLLWSVARLSGRDSVYLQWNLAPSPAADSSSSPPVPPDGFLVEVSTLEQGLYLGWYAPVEASTGGSEPNGTPRYTTGLYRDGGTQQPLRIFGGADSIQLEEGLIWEECFNPDGSIRPGARPVFFLTSPTSTTFVKQNPIPVRDGRYYNQRTFYVGSDQVRGQSWIGATYSINIPLSELPLKADINLTDGSVNLGGATAPDQVWVRVLAVNNTVQGASDYKWRVVPYRGEGSDLLAPATPVSGREVVLTSRGLPSNVATAMISNEGTDLYMLGLQSAITLALLSRSDLLPPTGESTGTESPTTAPARAGYVPTGLEPVAQNLIPTVFDSVRRYFVLSEGPTEFSEGLRNRVGALAATLVESQGNLPPSLIANLRPRLERLVNWKWNQSEVEGVRGNPVLNWTIKDALAQNRPTNDEGSYVTPVVAKNSRSLPSFPSGAGPSGIPSEALPLDEGASQERALNADLRAKYRAGSFGRSSILNVSESAPLLCDGESVWYVRDVVSRQIYQDAQAVLQLAGVAQTVPPAGNWLVWRPFAGEVPGFSSVSDLVETIQGYAEALESGLKGVVEAILDFISALEQRVKEIQELIRRIDSYLRIPLSFEIPDALILPVLASGTNGIVSGLASAGNKPSDGPKAYSAGFVIAAGGLPSLITDLLLIATS